MLASPGFTPSILYFRPKEILVSDVLCTLVPSTKKNKHGKKKVIIIIIIIIIRHGVPCTGALVEGQY